MIQTAYQAPLFFPTRDAVSSQEYLLVISPDKNITGDIRHFRNRVWELIGDYQSHLSDTHITIYNFLGFRQNEEAIKNALYQVSRRLNPAYINLENFSCFEASGTIYLTPKPKNYFSQLLRTLYPSIFNCSGINRQSMIYSSTEPHITIARGLKREQFVTAWDYFREKSYSGSFVARSIQLFRKEFLDNDPYQLVDEFSMK